MESYLFADVEAAADTMVVEGYHKPGSLTRSSGAWIHAQLSNSSAVNELLVTKITISEMNKPEVAVV